MVLLIGFSYAVEVLRASAGVVCPEQTDVVLSSANCRGDGRHNGDDLIGFCDGHAKWYTMTELKVDYPATRIYYYPPHAVTMVEAGWWILPQAFD